MTTISNTISQQLDTHFSHQAVSEVAAAKIWAIWTDVPNWHLWDSGLKSASLKGPFVLHAKGRLVPDKGPKARFKVVQFEQGRSYTIRTALPFSSLEVTRFLEQKNGKTYFTHEVRIKGLLKGFFGKKLGRRYRQLLPDVLEQIKQLAEASAHE